jgi:FMN phosphatase YigB (HAD superfamily)
MIDTDKYGMTNEELLERYSNLSVDDYKDLLAEVNRLREGIRHILSDESPYDLEVFERKLMELIE